MWVPNRYSALLLEQNITPVNSWTQLYGSISSEGLLQFCTTLINYLRFQLLVNVPLNTELVYGYDLVQPQIDARLLRNRLSVLKHMAPSSATSPHPTSPVSIQGMSSVYLTALIKAIFNGHTAPSPSPSSLAVPSVKNICSVNIYTLLNCSQSASINDLAPIWQDISKGPRKEERAILQAALDDHDITPGSSTSAPLLVFKELLSTVVNLVFWSENPDRLNKVLHLFRTLYTSSTKNSQDHSKILTYNLLSIGGNLSFEDILFFQLVLKSSWPTDFIQLYTTLKLFHNILAVLLERTHPICVS